MNGKKQITTAIFDLDGTLIDSRKGIVEGLVEAFRVNGLSVPPHKTVPVGPPLYDTIIEIFPDIDNDTICKIINSFRDLYHRYDLPLSKPFPKMVELLELLCECGIKTYVATYKPKMFSKKILEKYFKGLYIDVITPTELPTWVDIMQNNCTKTDIVKFLVDKHKIDCSCGFMAGDAISDIEAAHNNNLISIAAKYGYGGDLLNAKYNARTTSELFDIIINLMSAEQYEKEAV